MAKSAKDLPASEIEVSERFVNTTLVKGVLAEFAEIESARGRFMNVARRRREAMAEIYEGAAQKGIPQKVSKLQVEIVRAIARLKGKIAELDSEQRKIALKVAKAHGLPEQLAMFRDLPAATPPEKPEPKAAKSEARNEPVGKISDRKPNGDKPKGEAKPKDDGPAAASPGVSGETLATAMGLDRPAGNA